MSRKFPRYTPVSTTEFTLLLKHYRLRVESTTTGLGDSTVSLRGSVGCGVEYWKAVLPRDGTSCQLRLTSMITAEAPPGCPLAAVKHVHKVTPPNGPKQRVTGRKGCSAMMLEAIYGSGGESWHLWPNHVERCSKRDPRVTVKVPLANGFGQCSLALDGVSVLSAIVVAVIVSI